MMTSKYLLRTTNTILILIPFFFVGLMFVSCEHEPELMPGTPEVCFEQDVMLIINSNCNVTGCHGSGGEAPSLSTYEDIIEFIEPGDPSESELYEVITARPNSEDFMPPKPKQGLTSEQIDIINIWILQGATNTPCL